MAPADWTGFASVGLRIALALAIAWALQALARRLIRAFRHTMARPAR